MDHGVENAAWLVKTTKIEQEIFWSEFIAEVALRDIFQERDAAIFAQPEKVDRRV